MDARFAPFLDRTVVSDLLAAAWQATKPERAIVGVEVLHAWRKSYANPRSDDKSFLRVCYAIDVRHRELGESLRVVLHGETRSLDDSTSRDTAVGPAIRLRTGNLALELQEFPYDAALPQLQTLTHPSRVLEAMPPSARTNFRATHSIRSTPVSYRPGERCTLALAAYVNGARTPDARVFAKTFSDDRAVQIGGRLRHLARELHQPRRTLRVPTLFVDTLDERTLWMPELRGTPALEALDAAPAPRLQKLVAALAELHAIKPVLAPTADRAQRLEEAHRKVRKLARAFPFAESYGARAVERCASLLPRLAPQHDALCHGDAHLGQFAFLADGVAMFDVDELVRGDFEADLASLAVSVATNSRVGIEGVRDSLTRIFHVYSRAPTAVRPIDPQIYEFYRRLQLIDRAYRDHWRHGAVMRFAIEQALRAAAENDQ